MVDPKTITDFDLSHNQLEERILFWVLAAGKNGTMAAKNLRRLHYRLDSTRRSTIRSRVHFCEIFNIIQLLHYGEKDNQWLASDMKHYGIGCYNNKSQTFIDLAHSGLDLKKCTVAELEAIKGIGPKTARGFIIHSRPDQKYACLDTHLLRWLGERGHKVPKSTPTGKRYRELEAIFLNICEEMNTSPAELDLEIWNQRKR